MEGHNTVPPVTGEVAAQIYCQWTTEPATLRPGGWALPFRRARLKLECCPGGVEDERP